MRTLIKTFLALTITLVISAPVAHAATPLVDVDWVTRNLDEDGVVFLDVRGGLSGATEKTYLDAHIPGAIRTDYLKDGWRLVDSNGTIGQLPTVEQLEALIGDLGISNDNHVVIVPTGATALDVGTATRIYWTFKVLGHDAVSILDGGMAAYTAAVDEKTGKPVNPLETGRVERIPEIFEGRLRPEMLVSKAEVVAASHGVRTLVDNRPYEQYLGISKHGKAARAGTIPGARNLPENWLTLNGGGAFRTKAEIERLYRLAGISSEGDQITFCNTGHWASLGWFAAHEILGNRDAKLYDGSMVEWTADDTLDVQSALASRCRLRPHL
jgi:thiosulfate/3-mercaptopyruvate sulfurtransferase